MPQRSSFIGMQIGLWAALGSFLLLGALLFDAQPAAAQFTPPTQMMDTLNQAPVGPGGNYAVDRAQQAADGNYYGAGPGGGPGQPGQPYDQRGPQQAQEPPLTLKEATKDGLRGRKVYDAFLYKRNRDSAYLTLDDIRYIKLSDEQVAAMSDDGKTGGDLVADDAVYTSVSSPVADQYIGHNSFANLAGNIQLLQVAQKLDPLEFFGLRVMTLDRFSSVPKLRDRLAERDARIYRSEPDGSFSGWSKKFLSDYRLDPNSVDSQFYPIYVPMPPDAPGVEAPPAPWTPPVFVKDAFEKAVENYLSRLAEGEDPALAEKVVRDKALDPAYRAEFITDYGDAAETGAGQTGVARAGGGNYNPAEEIGNYQPGSQMRPGGPSAPGRPTQGF